MREVTNKSEREMMIYQYRTWCMSEDSELWDVYGRCSEAKRAAMAYCKGLMESLDGHRLRIIGHNSQMFSVGFEFSSFETGALCFAYITNLNERFIELTWKDGVLV